MALFSRREKPPAPVLALLDKDERMLSWGDTPDGASVVATNLGVFWPFDEGVRRMPWPRIDKVIWREGVMTVIEADVFEDQLLVDRAPVRVALSVTRDLPAIIRKRVEANIVRTELLSVGGGAVRFVSRRRPGEDGVFWWARLEPGTRATDDVRSAIAARLALLRANADAR